MTNQQGAQEAPKVRTADYEAGWKDGYKQGAWAAQQPAPSPAPAVGQDDLRAARSDGYAQGVASAVPKKVTADMRRVFREAYREGGFLADRLDYALDRMLAAAHQPPPTPQADTQPAPVQDGYPPLPEAELNAQGTSMGMLPHYEQVSTKYASDPDVVKFYTADQMRAYVDADRAARAPADSVLDDAARYRHLRDCNSGSLAVMQITGTDEDDWFILTEDDADAAIDAARKQGGAT